MTPVETDGEAAPNRFFFSTARDLYFLTYTIAIIIHETQTEKGGVVDPGKLPFLVPFVTDARLADIAVRRHAGLPISLDDRIRVHSAETQGRRLRPLVHRLIFSLAERGHLAITGTSAATAEVAVPKGSPLYELASDRIFQYERQNLRHIRGIVKLRQARSGTLRERLFFVSEDF